MSKELKNIKDNIMDQIQQGKIKMKSKIYFIVGSILTFIGLISSIMISIFLIGFTKFLLRSNGQMSQYRLSQMISHFPWWILILAIISLIVGIIIIRKYDFSYKTNPFLFISGFILMIIITGFLIDTIGINDMLSRRGPIKNMINNYFPKNNPPIKNIQLK